jgi:hypothetical protein
MTFICRLTGYGQQNTASSNGSIKGIVIDTAHNYALRSATVTIYKASTGTMLSYQITNNLGEFLFKNLPSQQPLKVSISHIGYKTLNKTFTIPTANQSIDLGELKIATGNIELDEVKISVPPITMNGDTLEFNPAAFKLDSNAVVEDLLRKIPNITVWGDGTISVNGRDVKRLLVNGKEFFTGDAKIATQNLPKNIIEKIQVYKKQGDSRNPLDSLIEMNLKTKKGSENGYFGKIGAGYGTEKHYELDGNVNFFSPHAQLSLAVAKNNVNKIAKDIPTLITNSSFKGIGTNIEYMPDFRAGGITSNTSGGISYKYDFLLKPDENKNKQINADYFVQNKNYSNLYQTKSVLALPGFQQISENNSNSTESISLSHKQGATYNWLRRNKSLKLSQRLTNTRDETTNIIERNSENSKGEINSYNNTRNQDETHSNVYRFEMEYRKRPDFAAHDFLKEFIVSYSFDYGQKKEAVQNLTTYRSLIDTTQNKNFDRHYDNKSNSLNQRISLLFPNFKNTIFNIDRPKGINFDLSNVTTIYTDRDENDVKDRMASGLYTSNDYLTNNSRYTTIDEVPGLNIKNSYVKKLANRFYKSLDISIGLKGQFFVQKNNSLKAFQNIDRRYNAFIPTAAISYNDRQYGEYEKSYVLDYSSNQTIPNIQQLAPLIDSTNLYYIRKGNLKLKPSFTQNVSFLFSSNSLETKNTLKYSLGATIGFTDDNLTDSIEVDRQNIRNIYTVNAGRNKFMSANGNLTKVFKLKGSEIQLRLYTYLYKSKTPNYFNGFFNLSDYLTTTNTIDANLTVKDRFAINLKSGYYTTRSVQNGFSNISFASSNFANSISASYRLGKRLSINSNINANTNISRGFQNINYTIWNASTTYRFLKGNNGEVKFSALDLLRENVNVINRSFGNTLIFGSQTVLQQYFMVSLSYYPRMFGNKTNK